MFVWGKDDLNSEQEAAVRESGSVFLVACPGSGKTRTLTYKIASELSKLQSDKQRVAAITYTHRAADEIIENVEILGVDASRLWIGTIHSFCLEWILKPYAIYHPALKDGFRIINSHETEKILTELCKFYRNPKITYWDCGHYYTPRGLTLNCTQVSKRGSVQSVLSQYLAILQERHQVDFEMILRYAYELISTTPSISVILSSLFSHVLIDEYQDTKEIQYSIIASILRAGNGKVGTFIVGDPNQAIYRSLGGYAITAGEFLAMAGIDLKEMDLCRNYRSSDRIVSYFANYNVHDTRITSASKHKGYASVVSFDSLTSKDGLEDELVRLIRYNIETLGIAPNEVCVLAPQWVHLASMTRRLVASLPEYSFDGPGMVPFSRDMDNFWYKVSKIILTSSSPDMYVRRLRWAGEILTLVSREGVDVSGLPAKSLLRECNSITISETDGLRYLEQHFDLLFKRIGIDFRSVPTLQEHHEAFFESSKVRVDRLRNDGNEFLGDIAVFRKVFENRTGITVSTIHGVKGAEYDTVIAYALLEGMVPHFSDPDGQDSAMRLLYVIASRARKHLHLIAERGRVKGNGNEYLTTFVLDQCGFDYDELPGAAQVFRRGTSQR